MTDPVQETDATYKTFGSLLFDLFLLSQRNDAIDYQLLQINTQQKIQDAFPSNTDGLSGDIAHDMIRSLVTKISTMLDELTEEFEELQDRPAD